MRTKKMRMLWIVVIYLLLGESIFGQIKDDSNAMDLFLDIELYLKYDFEIPPNANSLLIDSGEGKLCSCQFFASPVDFERKFKTTRAIKLEEVTVKGLFDGSQLHVFRLYLAKSNDYFKLKCYSKKLELKHIEYFFNIKSTKEKSSYASKEY